MDGPGCKYLQHDLCVLASNYVLKFYPSRMRSMSHLHITINIVFSGRRNLMQLRSLFLNSKQFMKTEKNCIHVEAPHLGLAYVISNFCFVTFGKGLN
jgi:hypothetical protein